MQHVKSSIQISMQGETTMRTIKPMPGLREGVLLPEAARRYWLREGDKKLLLKWLLLHKVIEWGEGNA
jgi:hypothetical protein